MIRKTVIKYSSMKVYLSLIKDCTSTILFFIKSSIKFTTSLSVYYSFFTFNIIIKNKKTVLKYYKKKIIISLLKVICLLTLNTYKAVIIDLELSLWSSYN